MKRLVQILLPMVFLILGGCSEGDSGTSAEDTSTYPRSYRIGLQRLEEGNVLGAVFKFEETTRTHPDLIEAVWELADAYSEAGPLGREYFEKSEEVYLRLASLVPHDDPRLMKGMAALRLRKWKIDEALAIYEEALAAYPEDCEFWRLYAGAQVRKAQDLLEMEGFEAEQLELDEARISYEQAIKLCPKDFDSYAGIAAILSQRRLNQMVVDMYSDLRDTYPDEVKVLRGYTKALFRARDWGLAALAFEELIAVDPDPQLRLSYISTLRKLGRVDEIDAQVALYKEVAPVLEGPVERTKLHILRDKVGAGDLAQTASDFLDAGDPAAAEAVWRDLRGRINPYLRDPEFIDAAEELVVWVERRIRHAQNRQNSTN